MLSIILTPTVYRYDAETISADDPHYWLGSISVAMAEGMALEWSHLTSLFTLSLTSISNLSCFAGISVNFTLQKV